MNGSSPSSKRINPSNEPPTSQAIVASFENDRMHQARRTRSAGGSEKTPTPTQEWNPLMPWHGCLSCSAQASTLSRWPASTRAFTCTRRNRQSFIGTCTCIRRCSRAPPVALHLSLAHPKRAKGRLRVDSDSARGSERLPTSPKACRLCERASGELRAMNPFIGIYSTNPMIGPEPRTTGMVGSNIDFLDRS